MIKYIYVFLQLSVNVYEVKPYSHSSFKCIDGIYHIKNYKQWDKYPNKYNYKSCKEF